MPQWISSFFAWPDGGVWSNLLASVIWTLPALEVNHRRMKRHVSETVQAAAPADAPQQQETHQ